MHYTSPRNNKWAYTESADARFLGQTVNICVLWDQNCFMCVYNQTAHLSRGHGWLCCVQFSVLPSRTLSNVSYIRTLGEKVFHLPPRLLPIPLVMTAHERAVRNMALCFLDQVTVAKVVKLLCQLIFKNALDVWTFQLWRFTFYFIYIILHLCTNEFKATVR